jgi:methyl-accepting chemotaxis protein
METQAEQAVRERAVIVSELLETKQHDAIKALQLLQRNETLLESVYVALLADDPEDMVKQVSEQRKLLSLNNIMVFNTEGKLVFRADSPKDTSKVPMTENKLLKQFFTENSTADQKNIAGLLPLKSGTGIVAAGKCIRADEFIGAFASVFSINNDLALNLKKIAGNDIIFLQNGKILASTFTGGIDKDAQLVNTASDQDTEDIRVEKSKEIGNTPYMLAYSTFKGKSNGASLEFIVCSDRSELEETISGTQQVLLILLIVGIILSIAAGTLQGRKIAKPILDTVAFTNKVAKGDLSFQLEVNNSAKDELSEMGNALNDLVSELNKRVTIAAAIADSDLTQDVIIASDKDTLGIALEKMTESLNAVMDRINQAVEQVTASSGQISNASQSLSQGATESAASLEEITSSMTEIGSQSKQNAENAHTASTLAVSARDEAGKGSQSMKAMTEAMTDINTSSQEISKIIKVIDDIAFQTNLLALNAAVEAARAGRHGKGFAVVAEEVRNLAGRSAKAAKETSELIESSTAKVENGTKIADQTSEALKGIVDEITKAADLVGEISAASNEQAQGVAQVSQELLQIDGVTQQNTANAEETASAAEMLSTQANMLQQHLAKFKLKQGNANYQTPVQNNVLQAQPSPASPALPAPAADTWGGAVAKPNKDNLIDPKAQIKLDDSEFGKY